MVFLRERALRLGRRSAVVRFCVLGWGLGTVVSAPAQTITVQPPSFVFATAGQSATWSVSASGSGVGYQWRKQGTPLAGATTAGLTLNGVSPGDAGFYDVVLTAGTRTLVSQATRLEVRPASFPTNAVPRPGFPATIAGPVAQVAGLVAADDGFLAFGGFTSVDQLPRRGLVRFTAAGTVDPSFDPELNFDVLRVLRLPDGRWILNVSNPSGSQIPSFLRIHSDGSRDHSYAPPDFAYALAMAAQADGGIVFTSSLGTLGSFWIFRRRRSGSETSCCIPTARTMRGSPPRWRRMSPA